MRHNLRLGRLSIVGVLAIVGICPQPPASAALNATVGAYYFEGWWNYSGVPSSAPGWQANSTLINQYGDRDPTFDTSGTTPGNFRDDTQACMNQQIGLAADHGVSFFNFDWYWISPTGTSDPTLSNGALYRYMAASNSNRMKMAVNLCEMPTTTADWQTTASILMPIVSDPRYQRVGGQPLITVVGDGLTQSAYNILQTAATAAGLPGLAIASYADSSTASLGGYTTRYNTVAGGNQSLTAQPFSTEVAFTENYWNTDRKALKTTQKYIPSVIAGWDKRPYSPYDAQGWYFPDRTPAAVGKEVTDAIKWMNRYPSKTTAEKIIMLDAWNEYGEGSYIAPTKGDPKGLYLDALASAVGATAKAATTFIGDRLTNGVIFNDNFEGHPLGTLGSPSAPTGSWASYGNGGSTVKVVNAATGGFAAYEGSRYLQIGRPENGSSVAAWAYGLESASEDFDTIVATFAFRVNTGGNVTIMPGYGGTELAELYLRPTGAISVLSGDESAWIPLTQTYTVGAWNTITISRTNGDWTSYSEYGSDYSVSVNGQAPETMPQFYLISNNRLMPFTQLEFNGQGGTFSIDAVAEPSSVALLAIGLSSLLAYAWRKRRQDGVRL